jgi:dTDP-4-amino-4,6-dideoxygalactose transaminase
MMPVARPRLPSADKLRPYLVEIDQSRIYSNFGPLCRRFEARAAGIHDLAPEHLVTVANGTVGLACGLLAVTRGRSGRCYLPSWTFCASAHAARLAGLEPTFVDVEPDTWQITPESALAAIRQSGEAIAVMPVAPFGSPVDAELWDGFTRDTGIKVVIDAAASFGMQRPGLTPVVVSLQATKTLGVGEGGFVASRDAELVQRVRQVANFGFKGARIADVPALNGKMSEFSAAVGLAALDCWPSTRERWMSVQDMLASAMAVLAVESVRPRNIISSTFVARFPLPSERIREHLRLRGVDTRRWWGFGCHKDPAFVTCSHGPLPVTEELAEYTLGLPFFVDMTETEISRLVEAVAQALC